MVHGLTATVVCAIVLAQAEQPPDSGELLSRIDQSLHAATRYLVARQHADGAWRSDHYGVFKNDLALTPFVLTLLHNMPSDGTHSHQAYRRGVSVLLAKVDESGVLQLGAADTMYPAYTTAAASWAVVLDERSDIRLRAQRAYLKHLRSHQLSAQLGWSRADPSYGGWGYSVSLPHKPARPEGLRGIIEANISATLFAIGALRIGQVPLEDPVFADIRLFIGRCQNLPQDPAAPLNPFDDGGFYFSPSDPTRNKAGSAGTDADGRLRFHSYGSATADGLRALIRCGVPYSDRRLKSARRWLEWHFRADTHPGTFEPQREPLRDSYYYYYCWSSAHAFMALGATDIETARGTVNWARELAAELLRRQQADGSWANPYTDSKEDDPLIATPFAAAALEHCRRELQREQNAFEWDDEE